jgi:chromosome segregation ATPase
VNEEVVCLRDAAIGNVNENTSANVNVNASANVNGNANLRGKLEDISANNKSQNDSKSNSHASNPPAGQKQNLVLQKEQGEKIESLEKIIKDYKEKLGKSTKEIDSLKEDMKEIMTRQRDSGTIATTAIIQIDKELSDLKQELDAKTLSNKKLELDIKQLQMEVIKLEKSEEELLDENMKLKRKREEFDNYKTNNVSSI